MARQSTAQELHGAGLRATDIGVHTPPPVRPKPKKRVTTNPGGAATRRGGHGKPRDTDATVTTIGTSKTKNSRWKLGRADKPRKRPRHRQIIEGTVVEQTTARVVDLHKPTDVSEGSSAATSTEVALVPPPQTSDRPTGTLVVPPGILPPEDFSWAKIKWGFSKTLRLSDPRHENWYKVPTAGKREQAKRDQKDFWYDLALQITLLRALRNVPGLIFDVMVFNPKGQSGKTERSLAYGSINSWFGGRSDLLLPTTLNTSQGDAGKMSGIPTEDLRRLTDIFKALDHVKTPHDLGELLPMNDAGLLVAAEDEEQGMNTTPNFVPDQVYRIIDTLKAQLAGSMVYDMANESINPDGFVAEIMRRALVIIWQTLDDAPPSREKMLGTMKTVRAFRPDFGIDDHGIPIVQKYHESVVSVGAVQPGNTVKFEQFLTAGPEDKNPVWPFQGATLTSPFEPTLHPGTHSAKVHYSIFQVDPASLLADVKVNVAVHRRAASLLQIDLSRFDNLKPNFPWAAKMLGRPQVAELENYVPSRPVDPATEGEKS